jgi:EXS family
MTLASTILGMSVETGVTLFYLVIALLLVLPGFPSEDTRASFFRLLRTCFFPGNAVTFPEVLLADAMTSISKVLKDFGVTIVAMYAQATATPIVNYHTEGMLLIALLASMPFW